MNVFCNGCGMCCKLIPVKDGDFILVRDGFQIIDYDFLAGLTKLTNEEARNIDSEYIDKVENIFPDVSFYSCKYLSDDNKCSLKQQPSVCHKFPSTALALIPDDCSCSGDIFVKNESLKKRIRMIKEEILDYETLILTADKKEAVSYRKIIENLTRFVTKYKDFGSDNW